MFVYKSIDAMFSKYSVSHAAENVIDNLSSDDCYKYSENNTSWEAFKLVTTI